MVLCISFDFLARESILMLRCYLEIIRIDIEKYTWLSKGSNLGSSLVVVK